MSALFITYKNYIQPKFPSVGGEWLKNRDTFILSNKNDRTVDAHHACKDSAQLPVSRCTV